MGPETPRIRRACAHAWAQTPFSLRSARGFGVHDDALVTRPLGMHACAVSSARRGAAREDEEPAARLRCPVRARRGVASFRLSRPGANGQGLPFPIASRASEDTVRELYSWPSSRLHARMARKRRDATHAARLSRRCCRRQVCVGVVWAAVPAVLTASQSQLARPRGIAGATAALCAYVLMGCYVCSGFFFLVVHLFLWCHGNSTSVYNFTTVQRCCVLLRGYISTRLLGSHL